MNRKGIILLGFILMLTGCSKNSSTSKGINNGNMVNQVIQEQINEADSKNSDTTSNLPESAGGGNSSLTENSDTSDLDGNEKVTSETTEKTEIVEADKTENKESNSSKADYDLTNMDSDMIYATVYQMMVSPEDYIGKSIRMKGLYYPSYYEPTSQYYHACLIQDALACCAQGIEFVWGDGTHVYPDDYPKADAEIVVQGIFETYQDEGDDNLYCRLQNATLEVVK